METSVGGPFLSAHIIMIETSRLNLFTWWGFHCAKGRSSVHHWILSRWMLKPILENLMRQIKCSGNEDHPEIASVSQRTQKFTIRWAVNLTNSNQKVEKAQQRRKTVGRESLCLADLAVSGLVSPENLARQNKVRYTRELSLHFVRYWNIPWAKKQSSREMRRECQDGMWELGYQIKLRPKTPALTYPSMRRRGETVICKTHWSLFHEGASKFPNILYNLTPARTPSVEIG